MIIKRIRKGRRQVRGTVPQLFGRIAGLTDYVLDARVTELPGVSRVRGLTEYALDLDHFGAEPGEKVSCYWGHNLPNGSLSAWQVQMTAAAALAVRSRDPVEHIVFSWPESEHPTDGQVKQAADIILEVVGYGNCLAVGAAHVNTGQKHGHVAVVRVDTLTGLTAGDGWDIDRLHQAAALIQERQGWAAEPNALYVARGGEVFCRTSGVLVRDCAGNQVKRARRARAAAPPDLAPHVNRIASVLSRAKSWAELHEGLEAISVEYVAKGSGAMIKVGEEFHKASALHPDLSRPKLEKRFGSFVPNSHRGSPEYIRYQNVGRAELARIRRHETATSAVLDAQVQAIFTTAVAPHDTALQAAIRAAHIAAQAELKVGFGRAKARCKEQQLSWEEWRQAGQPKASFDIPLPELLFRTRPAGANASPTVVGGFTPQHHGLRCDYVDASGTAAFSDYGLVIIVHDKRPAVVDAALSLIAQNGARVRVSGSDAFVHLCLERAKLLGIDAAVGSSSATAAKHASPAKRVSGVTHPPVPPGMAPIAEVKPPLRQPSMARAPPVTAVADQKPRSSPPIPAGTAPRSATHITGSQKENGNVRQADRRDGFALVASVINELHQPDARANTPRTVARSSSRLRNLPIGDVVRTGRQDTPMLLSGAGRSELVSEVRSGYGLRWAGRRLSLVESEAGGFAARLNAERQTRQGSGSSIGAGPNGKVTDRPAEQFSEEFDPPTDPTLPQDTVMAKPHPAVAVKPEPTIQDVDYLRDQQFMRELLARGRGR